MNTRGQRGLATVEFALVGAVLLTVIFAAIEFGRIWFISNALVEATRRGARMAAVCPVGDPMPAQVAILAGDDGVSRIDADLTTSNVAVSYLDASGAALADPIASFSSIRYVRVQIVDFTEQLSIPFITPSIAMPAHAATLPIESLGYAPTLEAFVACANW